MWRHIRNNRGQYLEAAGAVMGLLGARSQKKAAKRQAQAIEYAARKQAQTLKEIAAPWQEAGLEGIAGLRSAVRNLLAPDVDKEDPYLAARHAESLTEIERERERATKGAGRFWRGTGNVGKARGEELLIGQGALEAKNRENLAYGVGQQEYKTQTRSRLMSALGGLAGLGQTALSPLMGAAGVEAGGTTQAAGVRAGATSDIWSDLGALFGDIEGGIRAKSERKDWMDLLGEAYGTKKTTTTAPNTPTAPGDILSPNPITLDDILLGLGRKKKTAKLASARS